MHPSWSGLGMGSRRARAFAPRANLSGMGAWLIGRSRATLPEEPIDPRIAAHYAAYIAPKAEVFEARRLEGLDRFRDRCLIGIPAVLLMAALYFLGWIPHASGDNSAHLLQLGAFICFLIGAWLSAPILRYAAAVKSEIFTELFRFFGPQWRYEPNGIGASVTPYREFGVIPSHQNAHTEDAVSGTHKDIPLELFETILTTTTASGKHRRTRVDFQGIIIKLALPKRFTGHTVLQRDAGALGNWMKAKFAGDLSPIKLEDPRFEKQFEVYGSDPIEARYLLSPSFMERILALEDILSEHEGARCRITCAFKDGLLLMLLPSKRDWFSAGSLFQPVNFIPEINTILKEMDQLFGIIDLLHLDDKTGL